MATDYANIIPKATSTALLQAITLDSVVLTLGNVVRMAEGQESFPMVSAVPTAAFVNPRMGGKKPYSTIEWSAQVLVPEEVAVVCAIPTAFINDAGFPVWENVQPLLASAVAKVIDEAVLFGVGEPATFPATGLAGVAAPVTGSDAVEGISAGMAAVEASGLVPTGVAGGPSIAGDVRTFYASIAVPPNTAPSMSIYGLPVETTPIWDSSKGDALVGDWSKLIVGVREDIRFDTSDSAVITDGAGDIVANAFQDDLLAMRCFIRLGVVIGSPLDVNGDPANAFAMADWTTP